MKKAKKAAIPLFILTLFLSNSAFCEVISGKIDHNDTSYKNKIVDSKSQKALSGAKISIPELHYTTFSDKDGAFRLNADINDKTVLFVEKEGYKVFSLTIDNSILASPLKLGIEESSPFDMQITQGIVHLGDNMFSDNSANSSDFRLSANGPVLTQIFKKPACGNNQDIVLRIGTLIGLDTKKARQYGQNKIAKVYSSPAEVYVNGRRIHSLELNGDNIEIIIPKHILKESNELKIITGKNLFQTNYTDYDDIELANLRIEVKQKSYWAKH